MESKAEPRGTYDISTRAQIGQPSDQQVIKHRAKKKFIGERKCSLKKQLVVLQLQESFGLQKVGKVDDDRPSIE